MQNTLTITPLSTANATGVIAGDVAMPVSQAVVKHDTDAQPSIKLDTLGVPVTVSVGNTSTAVPQNKLAVMEQARKSWRPLNWLPPTSACIPSSRMLTAITW